MANLALKGDVYVARFRFRGKEYKRSLKTRILGDAKAGLNGVELTIYRLHTGQIPLPADVDPGDFIVSGGTLTAPVAPPEPAPVAPPVAAPVYPTTMALIERYQTSIENKVSENYWKTQKTHLSHWKKYLGAVAAEPCNLVTNGLVEAYLEDRHKIRDGETVNRERTTLTLFYKWVVARKDVPPLDCPTVGLPVYKGGRERDPFKTVEEITNTIERGGLTDEQVFTLWDSLYLAPAQIAELLSTIRKRAADPMSFMIHAIPAYTGMRRGEVLRLQWTEIDFAHGYVTARSRKQSRQKEETTRCIDLHGELREHLLEWQAQRPKGQFVISQTTTWKPITPDEANRLFWQPMRGTDWCLDSKRNLFKIGFHSYRHSFASNLASLGVDQRVIDEFMGHQTDEMRKRYRHLFPKQRRSAIESFSLTIPISNPS